MRGNLLRVSVCNGREKKVGREEWKGGVYRGLFSGFNFYSMHNTLKPRRWMSEPCGGGIWFFFGQGRRGLGRCFCFFVCFPFLRSFCLGKRIEGNAKGELPISEASEFVGRQRRRSFHFSFFISFFTDLPVGSPRLSFCFLFYSCFLLSFPSRSFSFFSFPVSSE